MSLPLNQVITGDCTEIMREWPENSVDCIVTDPPYGLSFMGKDWDKTLPPREAFDEIIRVLKPGALAFVMSSPRQDVLWRMLSMLEGVGFELRQSFISWIYKTGFPKAYDVSAGVDRKLGVVKQRKIIDKRNKLNSYKPGFRPPRPELNYSQTEIISIKKILTELFNKSGKTHSQIDLECGFRAGNYLSLPKDGKKPDPWTHLLPSFNKWVKIKEVLQYEENGEYPLLERWVTDSEKILIERVERLNSLELGYGVRFTNYEDTEIKTTIPFTDLAKKWEGWKSQTGMKPAAECVLMVNKPRSEPTIVDNVLRWGTGAMNVDVCRIPFQSEQDRILGISERESTSKGYEGYSSPDSDNFDRSNRQYIKGRFPANLLISNGALDTGKTTRSGKFEPHHKIAKDENGHSVKNVYGKYSHLPADQQVFYGDEGSPYRFFDLDAWAEHHGFLDVPKPSKAERDYGLTTQPLKIPKSKFNLNDGSKDMRFDGVIPTPRRNIHPTVKPVKLMAYLIELGCPPDGVVVDPFMGSGTTCIAAKKLRRKWIGIEINPEYAEIAEARINIRGPLDQFMEAER